MCSILFVFVFGLLCLWLLSRRAHFISFWFGLALVWFGLVDTVNWIVFPHLAFDSILWLFCLPHAQHFVWFNTATTTKFTTWTQTAEETDKVNDSARDLAWFYRNVPTMLCLISAFSVVVVVFLSLFGKSKNHTQHTLDVQWNAHDHSSAWETSTQLNPTYKFHFDSFGDGKRTNEVLRLTTVRISVQSFVRRWTKRLCIFCHRYSFLRLFPSRSYENIIQFKDKLGIIELEVNHTEINHFSVFSCNCDSIIEKEKNNWKRKISSWPIDFRCNRVKYIKMLWIEGNHVRKLPSIWNFEYLTLIELHRTTIDEACDENVQE